MYLIMSIITPFTWSWKLCTIYIQWNTQYRSYLFFTENSNDMEIRIENIDISTMFPSGSILISNSKSKSKWFVLSLNFVGFPLIDNFVLSFCILRIQTWILMAIRWYHSDRLPFEYDFDHSYLSFEKDKMLDLQRLRDFNFNVALRTVFDRQVTCNSKWKSLPVYFAAASKQKEKSIDATLT